jgi:hypothetical protein
MKRSRYSDEQIAYALRQVEGGTAVADVCRQMGISEATFAAPAGASRRPPMSSITPRTLPRIWSCSCGCRANSAGDGQSCTCGASCSQRTDCDRTRPPEAGGAGRIGPDWGIYASVSSRFHRSTSVLRMWPTAGRAGSSLANGRSL